MKKVSTKVFFTVMWRGLCQALGWFFGLFGYKRDGKFAKCVWGMFATSSAFIVTVIAIMVLWAIGDNYYSYYKRQHKTCDLSTCCHSEYLGRDIYYHNTEDDKGFVFNMRTGEKLVEHVRWIATPSGTDSLVCFSNGKKRGYFSKNTGKVIVEPKYDHAWVFSEGLACVDDNGYIKFIDDTGKTVIDNGMPYCQNSNEYVFHAGYCIISSDDDKCYGLMDKTGKMVLPVEYSLIDRAEQEELWRVQKGKEMAVFDMDMKTVLPFTEGSVYIGEGTIDVTMTDHTMRKYDLQGMLINDFYITGVRTLEYEKEEIKYESMVNEYSDDNEMELTSYHPKANARMRAYTAGDGYEGLMTQDAHIVTMPIYKNIEAIGYDLYLCESTNYDKVIVNGKGEIVR